MLLIGKQITSPGDPLNPTTVEKVFRAILNPNSEVAVLQKRLQAIRLLDVQQYRKLKTGLPYIVCSDFQPRVRKKENFVFTERFILDIDHLSEFDFDLPALRAKLKQDPRVELLFASPGGDGLKVLFSLQERISDSGYYALFYKAFCLRFAGEYQLGGAVDVKTNDVSRCCFASHDPEAYYNPAAEKVLASAYLPEEGASDFDLFRSELKKEERVLQAQKQELGIASEKSLPLSDDILSLIKQKVGVKVRKAVPKEIVQPEELNVLVAEAMQQLEQVGASVAKMEPIHYGRRIRVAAGPLWAEVNLFYGQRGVSVVGTTRTGSNKELCGMIVSLLKAHFQ